MADEREQHRSALKSIHNKHVQLQNVLPDIQGVAGIFEDGGQQSWQSSPMPMSLQVELPEAAKTHAEQFSRTRTPCIKQRAHDVPVACCAPGSFCAMLPCVMGSLAARSRRSASICAEPTTQLLRLLAPLHAGNSLPDAVCSIPGHTRHKGLPYK